MARRLAREGEIRAREAVEAEVASWRGEGKSFLEGLNEAFDRIDASSFHDTAFDPMVEQSWSWHQVRAVILAHGLASVGVGLLTRRNSAMSVQDNAVSPLLFIGSNGSRAASR